MFLDREDIDGEDESRPEFLCPFCAEDFDVVGLCCHIDEEHSIEAKNGVMIEKKKPINHLKALCLLYV